MSRLEVQLAVALASVQIELKKMAAEDWRGPKPSHISKAAALVEYIDTVLTSATSEQEEPDG